jgi:hypothetical protein
MRSPAHRNENQLNAARREEESTSKDSKQQHTNDKKPALSAF